MDTGVRAEHATLIFGVGLTPAFGSASFDGFALGASAVLLALIMTKSPKPLTLRWRPPDLWRWLVRLCHHLAGAGRNSWSRFRLRVDHLLVRMLGDPGERPRSRGSAPTRAYMSKHRQSKHRAPRHAAPPREPLSPPN